MQLAVNVKKCMFLSKFRFVIMDKCWQLKPVRRPTFQDIVRDLEDDLSDKFREVSFYFNPDPQPSATPEPETDDVVDNDNIEEAAVDDDSQVNHTTSLLHSETRPETSSLFPMENTRSSPKMPVDRLTLGPSEGSSVPDVFVDSSVLGANGGVNERLLRGQTGVVVQKGTESNHEPYADSHKGVAYKNRLTNGHIPYQSMSPSEGVLVRAGMANC
jgi:hypothetical protein